MNPDILRAYDIRGRVGTDLDPDTVRRLGAAFGARILAAGGAQVAVGHDVRESSPDLSAWLKQGILGTGVHVRDLGLVPTPLLYYAVHTQAVAGGIQITGSHNPPQYNGMKLMVGKGMLFGSALRELGAEADRGGFPIGSGESQPLDLRERYLSDLERHGPLPKSLSIVIDAGNGCASQLAPELFRRLGARVECLYCEYDGRFPNHIADPTRPETLTVLQERVVATRSDLGIAFDGDADRLGVVDETGRIVWGDELLAIFARDVLANHPGASILFEVKCSRGLAETIAKHGGVPVMTPTGHSRIKTRMAELGSPLAGEMSGHFFFRDWFGIDDALFAAARLCRLLAQSSRGLGAMVGDLPRYAATPELRVPCADGEKFGIVTRIQERYRRTHVVSDLDGARIEFGSGWGLVRASNTEPALVVRAEGRTSEERDAILSELESMLADLGVPWPRD